MHFNTCCWKLISEKRCSFIVKCAFSFLSFLHHPSFFYASTVVMPFWWLDLDPGISCLMHFKWAELVKPLKWPSPELFKCSLAFAFVFAFPRNGRSSNLWPTANYFQLLQKWPKLGNRIAGSTTNTISQLPKWATWELNSMPEQRTHSPHNPHNPHNPSNPGGQEQLLVL